MESVTPEQALQAAKGATFESVWYAFQKTDEKLQKMSEQTDEKIQRLAQQSAETDYKIQKMSEQTDYRIQKMSENIDKLSENIGGMGNKLGKFAEALFSPEIYKKFHDFGYTFTSSCRSECSTC